MGKFLKTRQGVDEPSSPRISEGAAPPVGPQRDLTQGIPEPLPDSAWNQLPGVRKCRLCPWSHRWSRDCHPASPSLQQGPPHSQDLSSPQPGGAGSTPALQAPIQEFSGLFLTPQGTKQDPKPPASPSAGEKQTLESLLRSPKIPFFLLSGLCAVQTSPCPRRPPRRADFSLWELEAG